MTMPFREAVNELDEASFQALYRPSDPMTPEQLADLLRDCGAGWIVAGGRAARVGAPPRPHADTDILFDLHSTDGEWVYKRDPRVRLPWQRAVHTVAGVEYLRPEIALLFKAKHDRPKDRADLLAARLDPVSRDWPADTLDWLGHREWALLTRAPGQRISTLAQPSSLIKTGAKHTPKKEGDMTTNVPEPAGEGGDVFGHEQGGTDEFGQETGGTDEFGQESGGTDEFGQEPGGTDEFGQETGDTDVFSPPKL